MTPVLLFYHCSDRDYINDAEITSLIDTTFINPDINEKPFQKNPIGFQNRRLDSVKEALLLWLRPTLSVSPMLTSKSISAEDLP